MNNISEYLKSSIKPKPRSQRAEVIEELYKIYTSQTQRGFRKRENFKRYISWLKQNRINEKIEGRVKTYTSFSKKKLASNERFIKEYDLKTFSILLSPFSKKNKNEDVLYYFLSLGRDMENRSQNFGSYLLGSIFKKI